MKFAWGGLLAVSTLAACSAGSTGRPGSMDALLRFAAVAQGSDCSRADCLPGATQGQEWKWEQVAHENRFAGQRDPAAAATNPAPSCDAESAPFGGGKGTQAEPFLVCAPAQWAAIGQAPGAAYRIVADLDFKGQAPARLSRFTGSLMGDSHRFTNIQWVASAESGLIDRNEGVIRDLEIENFRIEGAAPTAPDRLALFVIRNRGTLRNIRGGEGNRIELGAAKGAREPAATESDEDLKPVAAWRVGGLTAENSGTIEDCEWIVRVAVAPEGEAVGGIAAWNRGTLRRTTSRAWIFAPVSQSVGGVVGMNAGELRQVRLDLVPFENAHGDQRSTPSRVVGLESVGGLAGRSVGTIIEGSVWATVQAERNGGGAVGSLARPEARVTDVDFNGAVTGGSPLGGIVGHNATGALVARCRSDGMVEGTLLAGVNSLATGGVVGLNESGTVEACRSQGVVSARGPGVSGGVVGRNAHLGGAFAQVGGQVQGSTSSARVYAAGFVGGVVGENCTDCRVWDSSAQGVVEGAPELHCYYRKGTETAAGGIVGKNWGEIRGAFARVQASELTAAAGGCTEVGRLVGGGDLSRVRELVSRAPAAIK